MPAALAMVGASVAGRLTGDMMLTRDELDDLMRDILISHEPPRGRTRLSDWLQTNADTVGRVYASEVVRHYRRPTNPAKEAA
jgi:NADH dehydrogenase